MNMTSTQAFDLLGTDVTSATTIDDILDLGEANWEVSAIQNQTLLADGTVEPSASVSIRRSDNNAELGVHTEAYHSMQNRQAVELALEAVGLRPADSAVKHCGTLKGGAIFFANIDLGSLYVDPQGINDELSRDLTVFTSHSGELPTMLIPSFIRPFCANQFPAIRAQGKGADAFFAKHTKNMLSKLDMAKLSLGIADAAAKKFVKDAERMLTIPANEDTVRRAVDAIWGKPKDDASDNAKTRHASRKLEMVQLWNAKTNSPATGDNMYGVYQTMVEFCDHGKFLNPEKRAINTLLPKGTTFDRKTKALAFCTTI